MEPAPPLAAADVRRLPAEPAPPLAAVDVRRLPAEPAPSLSAGPFTILVCRESEFW